jgi:predicted NBD/HSP70 family sugar kinase
MTRWRYIELGGSSAQTVIRDESGRFWFATGIIHDPTSLVALACPGIIEQGRVRYATNLEWPADADPAQQLGIAQLRIVVNDAEAAALGEAILRSSTAAPQDVLYIALGTGVGSAIVVNQSAHYYDIGHCQIGGTKYCAGCQSIGCLNSELEARALPSVLSAADQQFVAQTLAHALAIHPVDQQLPIILGGGISRRYPAILTHFASLANHAIEGTAAPPEAKSAAYAGLDYLAAQFEKSRIQ